MHKGDENLIPLSQRPKEEVQAIGRKGGLKSGEVRRKKRTEKEMLKMLLGLGVTGEELKKQLRELGIPEEDFTYQAAVHMAMVQAAMEGSVFAYKALMEVLEESIEAKKLKELKRANRVKEKTAEGGAATESQSNQKFSEILAQLQPGMSESFEKEVGEKL